MSLRPGDLRLGPPICSACTMAFTSPRLNSPPLPCSPCGTCGTGTALGVLMPAASRSADRARPCELSREREAAAATLAWASRISSSCPTVGSWSPLRARTDPIPEYSLAATRSSVLSQADLGLSGTADASNAAVARSG
ncbi:hypothetical protein E2C01_023471 [Portunus trituberculatus]|uniref:Uncharacterized protein n=1 Tax=Portunus trituberculatus TaxID=210409 RepID=A0A5B7E8A3_PORTR|nr:hypothetical protein [Portunus trituberculatus]